MHDIELVHKFFSGNKDTGKSQLMKVAYNTISKTLLYHCKDLEKPKFQLFGPTEASVVNIGGTTIHSGHELHLEQICLV